MSIAEIRNMTPNGIHKGGLKTVAFSGDPVSAVSKKIQELYNQGFFMRRASPKSITRTHTLAEVIIRDLALKIIYRKNANGTLSYTLHNKATCGKT